MTLDKNKVKFPYSSQPRNFMSTIQIQQLSKNYGHYQALKAISFQIQKGEIVGFLGPNGAGKSTTLKILTGYLAPTEGSVLINGISVVEDPIKTQSQLGYLPEHAPIYTDMTIRDYLNYIAKIRGLGKSERSHAIEKVSRQCHIFDRLHQNIGELSKGYRQRVGLAQALIHDPPIVVLDEPTTGLDPNQIIEIRNLIREIGRHKTIILSTHILSEVQVTCDRVIIIHQGTIVADGKVQDIISQSQSGMNLRLIVGDGHQHQVSIRPEVLKGNLEGLSHVVSVQILPNIPNAQMGFVIRAKQDIRAAIFHHIVEQGLTLLEMAPLSSDLESVFHKLTEHSRDPMANDHVAKDQVTVSSPPSTESENQ